MVDLVIRGATIVDGLGHEPRRADLAVTDGRITAIGEIKDKGAETIDAGGLMLSPGIVDVHTHYDGVSLIEVSARNTVPCRATTME